MKRESHFEIAMREARKMARSKSKKKTSKIICHHLLQMLAEEEVDTEIPDELSMQKDPAKQMPLHFNAGN